MALWLHKWWWAVLILAWILWVTVLHRTAPREEELWPELEEDHRETFKTKLYKSMIESGEYTTVIIELPKNIKMIVPIKAIVKIDGYVLMMDPNFGDYTIIRDGVEETAPCVAVTNINRGKITFK